MILSCSLNSVSIPISYQTFSNAAYTAHQGNYQVVIEPKDIGEITVFNVSARFKNTGFGFSNMHEGIVRRNWGSIAYHIKKIPFCIGLNSGVIKIYDQIDPLLDLGAWYHSGISLGAGFSNILNDDKIFRGGISYTWQQFTAAVEIQDSIRSKEIVPHGIIAFIQPMGNWKIGLYGGFCPGRLSGAFSIEFRSFIHGMVLYDDSIKVTIGLNFRPPVVTKEITVIDTLLIDKPVIVEKTIVKKESSKPSKELTPKEQEYCEEHYHKGIKHYVSDEIDMAVKEWTLVIKVDPDYKDVQRYLENARAKIKLLKEK